MSLTSDLGGFRLFALGALLAGTMTASNLMQFALGALAPVFASELSLSRSLLGALITAYYVAAAVFSLLAAGVADRVGGRRAVVGLLLLAAVGFVAVAAAPTYGWLVAGVGLAGAATAMSNPTTNAALSRGDYGEWHGTLVGVKQAGVQIAAFIAGAALPPLALAVGWRSALLGCAAIGLALLPLVTMVPADAGAGARADAEGGEDPSPHRFPSVVRYLASYAFLMGAGMATVTTYLVLYAHERAGLGQGTAGMLLAVVGISAVVARIAWATVAGRLRGGWRTGLVGMAAAAVAGIALFVAGAAATWSLWAGAIVIGFSGSSWTAVAMLAVIDVVPASRVARASGHVLAGFYTGLCITPPAFGAIVDVTGAYWPAWGLTAAAFVAATALSWTSLHRFGSRNRARDLGSSGRRHPQT
ncbi:MAG: MFS transporter [Streptosporangiales bacterium]|nr:MFS transporter [Streptosporangiales bacterium]